MVKGVFSRVPWWCAGVLGGGLAGVLPPVWAQSPPTVQTAAPVTAAATPDSTDTADTPDAREVTWRVEIEAPDALKPLLERHLDLTRYLRNPDTAHVPLGELARLRQATPAQARALLETEGYFSATVQVSGLETGLSTGVSTDVGNRASPPAAGQDNAPIRLQVKVTPGPQAQVSHATLDIEGPLFLAAQQGDAAAQALQQRLQRLWRLSPGSAFTQDQWSSAKSEVLALMRAEGYALADWSGATARVEAAQHRVRVFLVLDSGPLMRFGPVQFDGLNHVDLDAVQALQTFSTGQALREQSLQDYQDRLVRSSLFDSVSVDVDPQAAHEAQTDAVPVKVKVTERSLNQATVGVGISDVSGPRITLEHLNQRWLGQAWQGKTKLQLAETDRLLSLELNSHPQPGPYVNQVQGEISQTQSSGFTVTSQKLKLGRNKDDATLERLYYLQWERSRTRDDSDDQVISDTAALSAHYRWVWRQLDHPLLPTKGVSFSLDTAVGRSYLTYTAQERSGVFGRVLGRLTHYSRWGNWYTTGRVQLGQVLAAADVSVPYTLLFRTGGDDSVRGYAFESLGPTNSDGQNIGGRYLAAGTAELAHPISASMPALLGATFVDAGDAAQSCGALRPALGYGVGLRWRSPVGALRLDVAYGQRVHRARLHFSVGITF